MKLMSDDLFIESAMLACMEMNDKHLQLLETWERCKEAVEILANK